jgi:hypothetical protein
VKQLIGKTFLCGHLTLVLWICIRNTILLVADGRTSLPEWARESAKRTQLAIAEAHALHAEPSAFLDQVWTTYEHAAGIDTGYGFFAPTVPNASKLVFEITYADGHPEYELPVVSDNAAGFRLCALLSQLPRIHYESVRELVMRMVTYSVWQRHPTAKRIRAVVGFIRVPPLGAARNIDIADYQFQYAYDFTFDTD